MNIYIQVLLKDMYIHFSKYYIWVVVTWCYYLVAVIWRPAAVRPRGRGAPPYPNRWNNTKTKIIILMIMTVIVIIIITAMILIIEKSNSNNNTNNGDNNTYMYMYIFALIQGAGWCDSRVVYIWTFASTCLYKWTFSVSL